MKVIDITNHVFLCDFSGYFWSIARAAKYDRGRLYGLVKDDNQGQVVASFNDDGTPTWFYRKGTANELAKKQVEPDQWVRVWSSYEEARESVRALPDSRRAS